MSNPRELIAKVPLTSGDLLELRMPTIGDVLEGTAAGKNGFDVIVEAATGMPMAEFKVLPATDGFRILTKLNDAILSMNTYLSEVMPQKKS